MAATQTAQIKLSHQTSSTSGTYPYAIAGAILQPSTIGFTTTGTSAGSIDQNYAASVTATTSGTSIQLNGGGLTDGVGDSFSPVRLDAITVTNNGTATVTMGGNFFASAFAAGTNYANVIPPGGYWSDCTGSGTTSAGLTVGSGTNSTLTFSTTNGTSAMLVATSGRSV